jgi:N-sulfoglucosamine sulfohydrolase
LDRAAILQGAVWNPETPSYPLLLKAAGYHIGQTYKVWSPGSPKDAPYGGRSTDFETAGSKFNQFSQNVTRMTAQGRSTEDAKQVLYDEVMSNFDSFMSARKGDEPFCYWFGPTLVHRRWTKGSGKAIWGIDPDALKGKLPKFLPDVPEVREDYADYLGEVQAFDHALGLILEKLEASGELENTLVVVSGDHGAPGFPNGKCNLYDFGTGVALAAWWPGKPGGRVVDDFVNLMDLAPTFLEVGGVKIPKAMTGRSLVNVLESDKTGQVDKKRKWVITGRERHVAAARAGNLPYPQRALRTKDYLYIVNFEPDRWPMGDPLNLDGPDAPSTEALTQNTFVSFMDMDASPTKAWMINHRDDPKWKWHYDIGFGKRPREELFILKDDPDQVNNVAADAHYASIRAKLNKQLMARLKKAKDPRVLEKTPRFEKPPFTDAWRRN